MPTAKEQLLSMMSPQAARLLDQQMRSQQVAQRSQGAGMLSGLVQAYTGMSDAFQGITSGMPMGANELDQQRKAEVIKKAEDEKKTQRGLATAEISTLVKQKIASKEITLEEGTALVRQVAQGLISFDDALKAFNVADSGEWRSLGDAKTIYNTKTGEKKTVGDANSYDMLTPKDILQYGAYYTTDSLEKWQNSISPENPSGDVSLLKTVSKETKTTAGVQKAYDSRQQEMNLHRSRAGKLEGLAANLEINAEDMSSGAKATVEGLAKELFGTQDYESILRTQVEEMRAQVAISNLPPGVASDADVALVLRGTLPANADPRTQARFLRGIAKIEKAKAEAIQDMQLYVDSPDNKDKSLIGYETHRLKRLAVETLDYVSFNSDKIPKGAVDKAISIIDSGNTYQIEKAKQDFISAFGVDFVTAYRNLQRN
jgi:hypothetical protein